MGTLEIYRGDEYSVRRFDGVTRVVVSLSARFAVLLFYFTSGFREYVFEGGNV